MSRFRCHDQSGCAVLHWVGWKPRLITPTFSADRMRSPAVHRACRGHINSGPWRGEYLAEPARDFAGAEGDLRYASTSQGLNAYFAFMRACCVAGFSWASGPVGNG